MTEPLGIFSRFDNTEHNMYNFEFDVDSENHVFNHISDSCKYYTDYQFNDNVGLENTFSLIHFNCRILYANFNKITDYLHTFKNKFKVIAISETWLNKDKVTDFQIEGYVLHHINRTNKRGGGVALYVDSVLKCTLVEKMTIVTDDLMECITIEIEMERKRNVVVTCAYRAPGSNVELFKDSLGVLMDGLNENKTFVGILTSTF